MVYRVTVRGSDGEVGLSSLQCNSYFVFSLEGILQSKPFNFGPFEHSYSSLN